MSEFNLGNFLSKVANNSLQNARGPSVEHSPKPMQGGESFSQNLLQKLPKVILTTPSAEQLQTQSMQSQKMNSQVLKMNHIEDLDMALYVKDLMNLPKDMKSLMEFIQKNLKVSQNSASLLASTIDINQLALLLQLNGKEALNKLIMTMSNAAKQGISDLTLMKETMKLINFSVSLAEQSNPSATLKSLMLLYLPWLHITEGPDFDIEFEPTEEGADGRESSVTILISTKNYGNIKVMLVLQNVNSVTIFVDCVDSFPKAELIKRIKAEGKNYSLQSNVVFDPSPNKSRAAKSEEACQQAKVNVSNKSNVNPFLLIMSQAVIKHTFEIDNAFAEANRE